MWPTFIVNVVDLLTAVFPGILKELILSKLVPEGPWTCGNQYVLMPGSTHKVQHLHGRNEDGRKSCSSVHHSSLLKKTVP